MQMVIHKENINPQVTSLIGNNVERSPELTVFFYYSTQLLAKLLVKSTPSEVRSGDDFRVHE